MGYLLGFIGFLAFCYAIADKEQLAVDRERIRPFSIKVFLVTMALALAILIYEVL
ncbi:hypothetical protein [Qipengyuania sp. RANM35]|uniref:hypothetical protein n=1 Tax=Qipengyuania sp. RANM35 TaxID=3068635 RepID=UPI0034DABC52